MAAIQQNPRDDPHSILQINYTGDIGNADYGDALQNALDQVRPESVIQLVGTWKYTRSSKQSLPPRLGFTVWCYTTRTAECHQSLYTTYC
jgi:hypothetical protein